MQMFLIINLGEEFVKNPIKKTFSTSTSTLTLRKVIRDKNP
jgi:hypothetical protein